MTVETWFSPPGILDTRMANDAEVTGCFFLQEGQGYYSEIGFFCACTDNIDALDWGAYSSCASGARAAAVAPAVCVSIYSSEVWIGWYNASQCNTAVGSAGEIGGTNNIHLLCYKLPG